MPSSVHGVRYAERGQALIMAVLIMFILVALGGLMIAMVNHSAIEVANGADQTKLDDIAQSGIQAAQQQILYGADGADWQPDQGPDSNNPGWISTGNGFYKTTVTYGPTAQSACFGTNPLDRYLQVVVESSYGLTSPPNPTLQQTDPDTYNTYLQGSQSSKRYLTRTLTAFVPIGLTDYLLWITNSGNSSTPATLGTFDNALSFTGMPTVQNPGSPALNDVANSAVAACNYLPSYEGPIRSECDLNVGNARIDLTNEDYTYSSLFGVDRHDQVQVVGNLSTYSSALAMSFVMCNGHGMPMTPGANAPNAIDLTQLTASQIAVISQTYLQTLQNDATLSHIVAPRLDLTDPVTGFNRYRALTLDTAPRQNGSAVVVGDGIYIDNSADIQDTYSGMWDRWLGNTTDNAWDPNNRTFTPVEKGEATLISLGDWQWSNGNWSKPQITMKHYTPSGTLDWTDTEDYPQNGVIFAEGNVVVKGNLPAAFHVALDTGTGKYLPVNTTGAVEPGGIYTDARGNIGNKYYVDDLNRRFDLTIVSNANVYIEGSILGPATRHVPTGNTASGADAYVMPGDAYETKLALLAMDNVCLNPTQVFNTSTNAVSTAWPSCPCWHAIDSSSTSAIIFSYYTAGPIYSPGPYHTGTQMILHHAGESAANPSTDTSVMSLNVTSYAVASQPSSSYIWPGSSASSGFPQTNLYFADGINSTNGLVGLPPAQLGGGLIPVTGPASVGDPFTFNCWDVSAVLQNLTPSSQPNGYGAKNDFAFTKVAGLPGNDYLIAAPSQLYGPGVIVTGTDLQVDALIYAQRGSWFVIPGKYYNEDPSTQDPYAAPGWPAPHYHEPMDVRIVINGAISENQPAPQADEAQWVAHWRGSNASYFVSTLNPVTTHYTGTPDLWDPGAEHSGWDPNSWRWVNRRMGIEYHYDATLEKPACYDTVVDAVNSTTSLRYYPRLPKLPVSPTIISFTATQQQ